jgi:DNA-binding GntR family transcriptional regulator
VSRSSLILALYARPHSPECAVNEHTGLIAALVEGDARAARRLMDHHLDAVQDRALLQPQADREQSLKTILAPYAAPAAGP